MADDDNFNYEKNTNNKQQSCRREEEAAAAAAQNSKSGEEFDENSQGGGGGGGGGEHVNIDTVENTSVIPVVAEMSNRASSPPETLATVASTDLHCNSAAAKDYDVQSFEPAEKLKDQVGISHQEELNGAADQAASAQIQNLQEPPDGPLSPELSPTSVTQSISSIPSPTLPKQKMSPVDNRNTSCMPEDKKNSFDPKTLSVVSVQKTPSPDGYNWRKYGQKQVKSPKGSRSYYRCTHSECYAKKIECSDDSNHVIEIVYRSHHNHDPPQKVTCTRGSRHSLSVAPVNGSDSAVGATGTISDLVPSTSSKDSVQETAALPDPVPKESSCSDDNAETDAKQEQVDEPEPRKRLKKTVASCSASLLKPGKKPKFVVHAAGDVGISADGYRWRKYGQKMVKGNAHPRNYYRCTSAGCLVRKHIERARDNTNAVIITYKGIHDHDMPVPKKRHGPPSAPLVAAAAPASMNTMQMVKPETVQNQVSATQQSVNKDGKLKGQTLECGGDKDMESTRTLLSIGFEIKPC